MTNPQGRMTRVLIAASAALVSLVALDLRLSVRTPGAGAPAGMDPAVGGVGWAGAPGTDLATGWVPLSRAGVRGGDSPDPGGPAGADSAATLPAPGSTTIAPAKRFEIVARIQRLVQERVPTGYEALGQAFGEARELDGSVTEFSIALPRILHESFKRRHRELRRRYLIRRVDRELGAFVGSYRIPAPGEKEALQRDRARLGELQRDLEWVESESSHRQPRAHREYLDQVLQMLDAHQRI